ncbi:glycogen/starch/alpha-glucan phosphorylase [Pseudomarimonas salicorniae]|uniref:Alpha-1,4 glucan phosphorylase n=1 Tax=Pseudomarimonas salicorniae TaxID=2933270 RepID=A0ABT0GG87_9GAMM|nr:glycogen/starch/alpha-glucan phosphorylase [Lysobacter sp. CAU 1642]MCK7593219.1 glycogen/starch/alpha-glucan phosphorylase [Lysobacter sp. CAU 1642]
MTDTSTVSPAPASTSLAPLLQSSLEAQRQAGGRDAAALGALRAAASVCRGGLERRWEATQQRDRAQLESGSARRVHYLSMEFLMGRALGNALDALGLRQTLSDELARQSLELGQVIEAEPDAALGNGGLGRLAACFLDSLAELGLPSFGYGLRYRYGMFAQGIRDGAQAERPDDWLAHGDPWSVPRPGLHYTIGFGGRVVTEGHGRRWEPSERVRAEAFDFIVPAHHGEQVSTLRLWQASAAEPIDFPALCRGEIAAAGQHQLQADALNWVLYPDDSTEAGRVLRLKQEYLLVAASLQDLLARHLEEGGRLHELGLRNAVHLNDTHPALAPAELMRLLLDEHGLSWDESWSITRQACSYTNHTLMPEALETWPVRMFETLLPRHLEIIYEINQRFLDALREQGGVDDARIRVLSLIDERGERRVRMAALAIVASHKVNGVAALHSKLMVETIFRDYAALWPERFINVTNGVTPRRWLAQCNPGLAALLDQRIGEGWRRDLGELDRLRGLAGDAELGRALQAVKRANKLRLAERIRRDTGIVVDADSLFDVQVKRIHEYKRQLLNLLHVVARYQAMLDAPEGEDGRGWTPRTVILAGKAASAYQTAKQIIRLSHDIARVVNSDARLQGRLKLVFLPNYGVSLAERIIPAADLSEQISTAGTEASGTGNMKFAMNGALTIGTWDGANIEMAEAIGPEHLFVFGRRTEQLAELAALGYDPRLQVEEQPRLRRVLEAIASGAFSPGEPLRHRGLVDGLLQRDRYFLLADFADYLAAQQRVDALYREPAAWAEACLRNIAGMGGFSTDRTIAEYQREIWAPAQARAVREEALQPRHAG